MIIGLFKQNGIPLINIVRREEQIKLLKEKYGAEHALNSEDTNFHKDLEELVNKLDANVAIECIAGEMPGVLLNFMPRNCVLI